MSIYIQRFFALSMTVIFVLGIISPAAAQYYIKRSKDPSAQTPKAHQPYVKTPPKTTRRAAPVVNNTQSRVQSPRILSDNGQCTPEKLKATQAIYRTMEKGAEFDPENPPKSRRDKKIIADYEKITKILTDPDPQKSSLINGLLYDCL